MLERRTGRVIRVSVALILAALLLAGTLMGISPVLASTRAPAGPSGVPAPGR